MFLSDNSTYKKLLEKYISLNERLLIMLDGRDILLEDLTDYREDISQINKDTEKLLGKKSRKIEKRSSKETDENVIKKEQKKSREESREESKEEPQEDSEVSKKSEEKDNSEKEKQDDKTETIEEEKEEIEEKKPEYVVIKEREFLPSLLEKYRKAREEIDYFYSENVNVLNIDCIKDFVIAFSSYTKKGVEKEVEDEDKEKTQYRDVNNLSVTISNYDDLMSLMLSDKKKVTISLRDRDLRYTKPQLLEILKFLEIVIKDTRYDELRYEITKRLSSS